MKFIRTLVCCTADGFAAVGRTGLARYARAITARHGGIWLAA